MPRHKKSKDRSFSRHSRDRSRHHRHSLRDSRHGRKTRDRSFSHDSGNKGRRDFSRSSSERRRGSSRESSSQRPPGDGNLAVLVRQLRELVAHLSGIHNLAPRARSQEGSCSPLPEASQAAGLDPLGASAVAHASAPLAVHAFEQLTEEQTVAQSDRGSVPGMSSRRPRSLEVLLAKRGHNRSVSSVFYIHFLPWPAYRRLS